MNLYELFTTLKKTSGTLDKIDILKQFFKYHEYVYLGQQSTDVDLLYKYLNPSFVCYFDKKMIKKAEKLEAEYPLTRYVDLIIDLLANRELTGNKALQEYRNVIERLSEEGKFVLDTILLKSSTGVSHKLVNRAHQELYGTDFIKIFECQLANKYEEKKNYNIDTWYISPKLDGLRCIYRDGKLFTRQNKPIIGFDHVENECKLLCESEALDMLDGELYSHDISFHEIQGIVVRNKNIVEEDKKKIFFNVFACTGKDIQNTTRMINTLHDYVKEYTYITIVDQQYIENDPKIIKEITEDYVKEGYEGAMLRHPNIHYENKRSNALLKIKFFEEDDFIITDIFEGEGRHEGKLGGFYIESIDGKIKAKVGSGFIDEQREQFWKRHVIWGESLVGLKVEVKYFEITPDNSLRFPVFLKLKEDR